MVIKHDYVIFAAALEVGTTVLYFLSFVIPEGKWPTSHSSEITGIQTTVQHTLLTLQFLSWLSLGRGGELSPGWTGRQNDLKKRLGR